LTLIAVLAPLAVAAHQLQVAMTTVTFKARTGSIEVIHRFYVHDAEHAMSAISGRRADIMTEESVQQQFGQYVSENFQLRDQDNERLPLSLVGLELEGDFLWVYQETPIPGNLAKLTVVNPVLLDLLPAQVNTVNVECGKELSTLKFSGDTRTAPASIDFSTCR
jgi:hypothetical protein